ncbi:MAG TPA: hypothetical protein VK169_13345 [Saprospiraceae bacterium]|nr:hypothetical protein [Saprospiraceae bacterium]
MINLLKSKIGQIALTLIIFLPLLWFQKVTYEKINEIIDRDGILIKATIIDVSKRNSVYYEYVYQNKKYKNSSKSNTPYFIMKCIESRDCLGDTIIIKMSQSEPEYARIVKHSNAELPLQ